jgi:uncharacterized protein YpmB
MGEIFLKKWIYGIVMLLVIAYGYYLYTLSAGNSSLNKAYEDAQLIAYNETGLQKPSDFYMYRGKEKWDVITGKNRNGTMVAIWIPLDKNSKIFALPLKSGITKDQALEVLKQQREPFQIIHTKLGCEQGIPLWEITYKNVKDKLCYFYVDFNSGKWLKSYDNL